MLILIIGFASCWTCLAESGRFFRAAGSITLDDGGKAVSIIIAASTTTDGELSPTVTWRSGKTSHRYASRYVYSTKSDRWKTQRWFVFVESASRIWMFDGRDHLWVLDATDKEFGGTDSKEDLMSCPTEVRDALPESVRKHYFQ